MTSDSWQSRLNLSRSNAALGIAAGNAAVFALQIIFRYFSGLPFVERLFCLPALHGGIPLLAAIPQQSASVMESVSSFRGWELWRWFSHAFLYGGPLEAFLGILFLYWACSVLEEHLGSAKVWLCYLGGCFAGGVIFSLADLAGAVHPGFVLIGSGAGFTAVFTAFAVLHYSEYINLWMIITVRVRGSWLCWGVPAVLILQAAGGFSSIGAAAADLGGFVWGIAGGTVLASAAAGAKMIRLRKRLASFFKWLRLRSIMRIRRLRCIEGNRSADLRSRFNVPAGMEGCESQPKTFMPGRRKVKISDDGRLVTIAPGGAVSGQDRLEAIMEKISSQGLRSLSDEERKFLDSHSGRRTK